MAFFGKFVIKSAPGLDLQVIFITPQFQCQSKCFNGNLFSRF